MRSLPKEFGSAPIIEHICFFLKLKWRGLDSRQPKNYRFWRSSADMELEQAFGETVRLARKAAHLKQEALAEALGIQASAVSRLERGAVSPSLRTVSKIAQALGVPPSELIRQAEQLQAFAAAQQVAIKSTQRRVKSTTRAR